MSCLERALLKGNLKEVSFFLRKGGTCKLFGLGSCLLFDEDLKRILEDLGFLAFGDGSKTVKRNLRTFAAWKLNEFLNSVVMLVFGFLLIFFEIGFLSFIGFFVGRFDV
jgi:hypothetical protein